MARKVQVLRLHIARWHRGNWRKPFLTESYMAADWDEATSAAVAQHPELVDDLDVALRVSEVGR